MTTATERLLKGRTITGFRLNPWTDREGRHHDPTIELDNGARLIFTVSEGECDYGVTPTYIPPQKGQPMKPTMKSTVAAARRAAEDIGARQIIVVAFDYAGRYAVTSYGITKAECGDVARLCDAIADGLDAGTLPAPEANR